MAQKITEYLPIKAMTDYLYELYSKELNNTTTDEEREYLYETYSFDYYWLREYSRHMAIQLNDDMGKYLNRKDQHIEGNWCNARQDYEREHPGQSYVGMLLFLENFEDDPKSAADRDWLMAWFFEAFGTFGLTYNFSSDISELLYEYDKEKENA